MPTTWKKVIVSGSVAELSASLYRATGQPLQQVTNLASTTVLSGSFSGSFSGNGAGLTNIPYSSLTGAPEGGGSGNLIFSGSLTASFTSNNGTPVDFKIVSGSTPTTLLTVQSSGITLPGEAFAVGKVTGSRSFLSSITSTPSAASLTISAVQPIQIKSWQNAEDTYWDSSAFATLINENTPISDILYFLLRPYAALYQTAGPNTRIYNGITATANTSFTTANPSSTAWVPQGTNPNATIASLITYGWQTVGTKLFAGLPTTVTIVAGSNLFTPYYTAASQTTGTTTQSSNASAFGFTTASINAVHVSASITYNTYTGTKNSLTPFTSTSLHEVSKNSLGSGLSSGIYLNTITAPVPPNLYQDSYFSGVTFDEHFRYKTANSQGTTITAPTIDYIGYYQVTASVLVASSSAVAGKSVPYIGAQTSANNHVQSFQYFYIPTSVSTLVAASIATLTNTTTVNSNTTKTLALEADSIKSSSLSGAIYYHSASFIYSESIASIFNPVYLSGDVVGALPAFGITGTNNSVSYFTNQTSADVTAVNIDASGYVNTANRVFDSTGTTVRSTGITPTYNDIVKTSTRILFDVTNGSAESNIAQTIAAWSAPGLTVNGSTILTPAASIPAGYSQTLSTIVTPTNIAGGTGPGGATIGGKVAWRKRQQTYQARTGILNSSYQGVEQFLCESKRIQINDNLLRLDNFNAWDTNYRVGTSELTAKDLQVVPGYLTTPGSNTYGYWIGNPGAGDGFKYYATWFSVAGLTGGAKSNVYVSFGNTAASSIIPWGNTTDNGIAAAILFESADKDNQTNARLTDIADNTSGTYISAANQTTGLVTAGTAGINPFGVDVMVYKNNTGVVGSTSAPHSTSPWKIPLLSARNIILNQNISTQQKFLILVRYKGDPAPISEIRITVD